MGEDSVLIYPKMNGSTAITATLLLWAFIHKPVHSISGKSFTLCTLDHFIGFSFHQCAAKPHVALNNRYFLTGPVQSAMAWGLWVINVWSTFCWIVECFISISFLSFVESITSWSSWKTDMKTAYRCLHAWRQGEKSGVRVIWSRCIFKIQFFLKMLSKLLARRRLNPRVLNFIKLE